MPQAMHMTDLANAAKDTQPGDPSAYFAKRWDKLGFVPNMLHGAVSPKRM